MACLRDRLYRSTGVLLARDSRLVLPITSARRSRLDRYDEALPLADAIASRRIPAYRLHASQLILGPYSTPDRSGLF